MKPKAKIDTSKLPEVKAPSYEEEKTINQKILEIAANQPQFIELQVIKIE